eukprot:TRINITY_DN5979_c0_g1_i1.p1 TRINITY_DN5979_c0_g1~~TRINITY_DN5979_c0_g1_i1.p1  ORF type:complete len:593 (+),score=114.69 TRINITY_DN5979_c0_g1_i1:130-1779(+)
MTAALWDPPTASSSSSMTEPSPTFGYRVVAEYVYRHWAPERVYGVNALFQKYCGREADLLDQILRKYVFPRLSPAECAPVLAEMLGRFDPARLAGLPKLLDRYKRREADLCRMFCDQYLHLLKPGDAPLNLGKGEPVDPVAAYRDLVERAYREWNPEKLDSVDKLVEKYAGHEVDLLDQIMCKYCFTGPRRLHENLALFGDFLARFAPAKLLDLHRLLRLHRHREAELFRNLCEQFLPCKPRDEDGELSDGEGSAPALGVAELAAPTRGGMGAVLVDAAEISAVQGSGATSTAAAERSEEQASVAAEPPETPRSSLVMSKRGSKKTVTSFEVAFRDGALGLAFRGVAVSKVVSGEQADAMGVDVGNRLLSLQGQEVPTGKNEDELLEWMLTFVRGPRPLVAVFAREKAAFRLEDDTATDGKLVDGDGAARSSAASFQDAVEGVGLRRFSGAGGSDEEDAGMQLGGTVDAVRLGAAMGEDDDDDVWDMDWSAVASASAAFGAEEEREPSIIAGDAQCDTIGIQELANAEDAVMSTGFDAQETRAENDFEL